jgi:hypothetical protein
MAKAIVKLVGCSTMSSRGRNFKNGVVHVYTDESDIEYFRSQAQFYVRDIEEDVPAKKEKQKPVPPPEIDEAEEIDEADEAEEVDLDEEVDADEEVDLDEEVDEDDSDEVEILTKSQLESMKKKQLVEIAEERLVLLTGDETKKAMIKQILEAQKELQN